MKKTFLPLVIAYALATFACKYIVLPQGLDTGPTIVDQGWSAVVTEIGDTESGGLRIDLAIQNNTGDWSAMQALQDAPAQLTSGGETLPCETVMVGTGGHRLAPGFRMRGFVGGKQTDQVVELIRVECESVQVSPGAKLTIEYSYVTGQYNYYEPDKNKVDDQMEIDLDQVAADLTYPIAEPMEGLVQPTGSEIVALNDVVLMLADVQRSGDDLQFTWQAANPGEYPTYVHVGNPPVIGGDGILYGFYLTPDIVSVPIVPAGEKAEWTTAVAVPQDVEGLYVLLSAESGKARLFANYALDVTDK